jgi:hypothetical protein
VQVRCSLPGGTIIVITIITTTPKTVPVPAISKLARNRELRVIAEPPTRFKLHLDFGTRYGQQA